MERAITDNGFRRDDMAKVYANRHLKTDPGIRTVYYLPADAPEREIRLVELNDLIAERDKDPLEPIDFGVDTDSSSAHTLLVLDVTPAQWEKMNRQELPLPSGWSLERAVPFPR